MIRGLSRIVPNVVVGVWLAMGFLIVQPVSAEEKVTGHCSGRRTNCGKLVGQRSAGEGYLAGR